MSASTCTLSLSSSACEVELSVEQVQAALWNILQKLPHDQQSTVLSNAFDLFLKKTLA